MSLLNPHNQGKIGTGNWGGSHEKQKGGTAVDNAMKKGGAGPGPKDPGK